MTSRPSNSSARRADLQTRLGLPEDAAALSSLINAAFVVEQAFIEGERINREGVLAYMEKGKFLLLQDSAGVAGCVYVEIRGDRGYVGLLSVDPPRQGSGLGAFLMAAAEDYFRAAGCRGVDLRIVSARTPLPAFYRRLGYVETSTAPFPADAKLKVPCHFIIMSKSLS